MRRRAILALLCGYSLPILAHGAPPPAPLPQTGQTTCYEGTALISCSGTGHDGDTRTGVAWPDPRFSHNGDQTLTDKLTGLAWDKAANAANGPKTWQQALDHIRTLNNQKYLGHADWRLPNVVELESLVSTRPNLAAWLSSQGFHGVQVNSYWTSTTYANYTAYAWTVSTYSGIVAARPKTEDSYVWPMRGGHSGVLALPKTGQTSCYDTSGTTVDCAGTGQDGEVPRGIEWPNPRFTDNADRTMTDRLTGLVWSKEAQAPGPSTCTQSTSTTWQAALDYVRCLNTSRFLGSTDWRLPNRNELGSLAHYGRPNTATWLIEQGFINVKSSSYWCSSTYPYSVWNLWSVNMHDGAITSMDKRRYINAWPVRGGQHPTTRPQNEGQSMEL